MTGEMKSHPLAIAARYNDAEAEEYGVEKTVKRQGFDWDEILHVAEQRALRVIAMDNPRLAAALKDGQAASLTADQLHGLIVLKSAILDGIMIGWRAKGLAR